MILEMSQLGATQRYKLLVGTVLPRPIALVTSLNEAGLLNAAPYSFFNAVGADPPLIVLGIGNREPGVPKDSAANILAGGEFVVNMVDEALAETMNLCATDFPAGVSEVEALGLEVAPSVLVKVPRLLRAPAALECRLDREINIGANRIILGEVLAVFLRDELLDECAMRVRFEALNLIGRMGGPGAYTRTRDTFELNRVSYADWQAQVMASGHTEAG